ncbi:MAG: ABC transporter permease subunit [Acidobacteria bacterium]|nr:ABC transporter permease subunit [Acidobacteriota bacterium]
MPAWRETLTWYAMELRSALRERSLVVNSILIPIFLYPVMIWVAVTGGLFIEGKTEGFTARVAFVAVPAAQRAFVAEIGRGEKIRVEELADAAAAEAAIRAGTLDAAMVFEPAPPETSTLPGNAAIRILHDGSRDRSREARDRLEERLAARRGEMIEREAAARGVAPAAWTVAALETRDRASQRERGQLVLGLMLPTFLLLMCAVGCFYPAIDATAGERERGTWETLASTGVRRESVVVAKYLLVATFGIAAGLLNLGAMTLSMGRILTPLLKRGGEAATQLSIPWLALPVVAAGTVLLALFLAAGMMLLASFARTFKEGQSLVMPLYLMTIVPVLFVLGTPFDARTALVPVLNVALMFREAIAARFDWALIALTLLVEAALVAVTLFLAARVLRFEEFLIGSHGGSLVKFLQSRKRIPGAARAR